MKASTFIRVHNDTAPNTPLPNDWEFQHPTRPPAYDETIGHNLNDNTRRSREANHAEKVQAYNTFEAMEQLFKQKIADAYDDVYLRNLRNDILGFSHVTVADMLDHLKRHCLAINNVNRAQKLREVHVPWDNNDDIYTFFTNIELAAQDLEDNYEIVWTDEMKTIHACEAMYKSGSFTKAEKKEWENKDEADKTWVHLQSYFGELWDADQQFSDLTAKDQGYGEGTNNIKEGPQLREAEGSVIDAMKEIAIAATADKEHIQQMSTTADDLLAVVKRQQTTIEKQQTTIEGLTAQISQLIKTNGELTKSAGKKQQFAITRRKRKQECKPPWRRTKAGGESRQATGASQGNVNMQAVWAGAIARDRRLLGAGQEQR